MPDRVGRLFATETRFACSASPRCRNAHETSPGPDPNTAGPEFELAFAPSSNVSEPQNFAASSAFASASVAVAVAKNEATVAVADVTARVPTATAGTAIAVATEFDSGFVELVD